MALTIVGFLGFGPLSHGVSRNLRAVVEKLREMGIVVDYTEVRLPLLDVEEFEPFALIDGREVYVPSVAVEPEKLVDYLLAAGIVGLSPLPVPPVAV